jgi:hypothetical protein
VYVVNSETLVVPVSGSLHAAFHIHSHNYRIIAKNNSLLV